MHTRLAKPLTAAAVSLIATILAAVPAVAEVHLVQEGESIQAAIDAAESGDVIFVMPGEYAEHLEIVDKSLTLRSIAGAETTTLLLAGSPDSASGIMVTGNSAGTILDGFTFTPNPDWMQPLQAGLRTEAAVTIRSCVFRDIGSAAVMADPQHPDASLTFNDDFFENCDRGVYTSGPLLVGGCLFTYCSAAISPVGTGCADTASSVWDSHFQSCGTAIESRSNLAIDGCSVIAGDLAIRTFCGSVSVRNSFFSDLSGSVIVSQGGAALENCVMINVAGQTFGGVNINANAPVSFRRCYFGNVATGRGNAVQIRAGMPAEITDCAFVGCHASGNALSVMSSGSQPTVIRGCTFADNGWFGVLEVTGTAPLLLSECEFAQNEGAVLTATGPSASSAIEGCTFIENAGVRRMWFNAPHLPVTNCRFERNTYVTTLGLTTGALRRCSLLADAGGGILLTSDLIDDCLFVGNEGIIGTPSAPLTRIVGSTFVSNTGLIVRAPLLSGCIVRSNTFETGTSVISAQTSYCNLDGNLAGSGNIDADPLFVRNPDPGPDNQWGTSDDFYGDLRLQPGSPCIDAASSYLFPDDILLDLAGNPRFVDDPATMDTGVADYRRSRPVADIGAYEFQPDAPPPCPCDFDANGRIETADLLIYVNLWFEQAAAANLDGDPVINIRDLLAFLDCFLVPRVDPAAC